MVKVCTKCGIEKDTSEFHKRKNRKCDVVSQCKICCSKLKKNLYVEHRINILLQKSKYYLKNRDTVQKNSKAYYTENKGIIAKKGKIYYTQHKITILKKHQQYYKTERGKLANVRGKAKRKSRNKNVINDLTLIQWSQILFIQANSCNICKVIFDEKIPATKDHIIPVSKGGGLTKDNVQALCKSCNSSKGAR